ncbi:MAG: hypothetical protein KatS3mg102_0409 [Planctomycetota bacterium]|nr:MAG: hypothetical protein KatS3mg102_0409 [Planctomycetota bacterium]
MRMDSRSAARCSRHAASSASHELLPRSVGALLVWGCTAALPGVPSALAAGSPPAGSAQLPQAAATSELEHELAELRARLGALEDELRRRAAPEQPAPGGGAPRERSRPPALRPLWERDELKTPRALRGVYDKPFLVQLWQRAYLGGYTELEFHAYRDPVLEIPRGFRAHRTNLFAFADVAERVRFAGEIEFEHEQPGEDLEVAVEMAFADWVIFEQLVVRGGVLLVPLGRINVNHDGPVRELTDRPLVSTFVIPTTLSEAGVGVHGSLQLPGAALVLRYEAYLVNGLGLLDRSGTLAVPPTEFQHLLREGRPSLGGDTNGSPAFTGRVALGLGGLAEAGFSFYAGDYDERNDNRLSIVAADLAVEHGPFALEGEFAWAGFERDAFARTAGVPDRFWGFYVQAGLGGMPAWLREALPYVFDGEAARLGVALRYERVDLDGDIGEAIEPGLSFRPFADTVFKASYRFALRSLGERDVPGRRPDDEGVVFGLASYF